ncbi:Integral membrane protein [Pelomyxa schiedti]|nr:Integral membrane protein [Pelomyxa schiedti]
MVVLFGRNIENAKLAKGIHILTGMLVMGTCTSISSKISLAMFCMGWGDIEHPFEKPFFQSILMFGAMALALPLAWIADAITYFRAKKLAESREFGEAARLVPKKEEPKQKTNPIIMMVPCTFDLLASTLMTFGLIYISVSVFQMLRGSMVIFSSILSRIFLGRPIHYHQMVGLGICCVALVMVGTAGMLMPQPGIPSTAAETMVGCCLVIFSQLIQAGQIVTEEFLLKNLSLDPLRVVGYEGLWGTLLMVFIACPLAYVIPGTDYSTMPHNSLENTIDSFMCMVTSADLIGCIVVFFVAVLLYNVYGMFVTDLFNAVNRTIFEAVRTTCIWVTDLVIYTIWPTSGFGEMWSVWSWLELGGFVVLISSSFVYNGILKIPGIPYPAPEKKLDIQGGEEPEKN